MKWFDMGKEERWSERAFALARKRDDMQSATTVHSKDRIVFRLTCGMEIEV